MSIARFSFGFALAFSVWADDGEWLYPPVVATHECESDRGPQSVTIHAGIWRVSGGERRPWIYSVHGVYDPVSNTGSWIAGHDPAAAGGDSGGLELFWNFVRCHVGERLTLFALPFNDASRLAIYQGEPAASPSEPVEMAARGLRSAQERHPFSKGSRVQFVNFFQDVYDPQADSLASNEELSRFEMRRSFFVGPWSARAAMPPILESISHRDGLWRIVLASRIGKGTAAVSLDGQFKYVQSKMLSKSNQPRPFNSKRR